MRYGRARATHSGVSPRAPTATRNVFDMRYGRARATHSGVSPRAPTATTMYCFPSCT